MIFGSLCTEVTNKSQTSRILNKTFNFCFFPVFGQLVHEQHFHGFNSIAHSGQISNFSYLLFTKRQLAH